MKLTIQATIDEVPAGRDLDMKIERAVFGQPSPVVPAYYSTGFSAGLGLQSELMRLGWTITEAERGRPARIRLDRQGESIEASGETFQLALCRAALKAAR
jgi:hypothetical protein